MNTEPTIVTILERLDALRAYAEQEFDYIKRELRLLNLKQENETLDLSNTRAYVRDHEQRLSRLEVNPTSTTERMP